MEPIYQFAAMDPNNPKHVDLQKAGLLAMVVNEKARLIHEDVFHYMDGLTQQAQQRADAFRLLLCDALLGKPVRFSIDEVTAYTAELLHAERARQIRTELDGWPRREPFQTAIRLFPGHWDYLRLDSSRSLSGAARSAVFGLLPGLSVARTRTDWDSRQSDDLITLNKPYHWRYICLYDSRYEHPLERSDVKANIDVWQTGGALLADILSGLAAIGYNF